MSSQSKKESIISSFWESYILDWLDVQPGFHDAMDMSMRIRMLITVTIEAMTKDQVNTSKGMMRA